MAAMIAVAAAAVVLGTPATVDFEAGFADYAARFGKSYTDADARSKAFGCWKINLESAADKNAKALGKTTRRCKDRLWRQDAGARRALCH